MELTPHHLWFTEEDIQDNFLECYPRLRTEENRDGLMQLLAQIGTNPFCKLMHGTDHAPHTASAKKDGSRGIPNFRDTLAMIITLAVKYDMTTTQLQQFFRGTAEICYPFIKVKEEDALFTTMKKESYMPDVTYYDGAVKNPMGGIEL